VKGASVQLQGRAKSGASKSRTRWSEEEKNRFVEAYSHLQGQVRHGLVSAHYWHLCIFVRHEMTVCCCACRAWQSPLRGPSCAPWAHAGSHGHRWSRT
jgi:hypothetical protein